MQKQNQSDKSIIKQSLLSLVVAWISKVLTFNSTFHVHCHSREGQGERTIPMQWFGFGCLKGIITHGRVGIEPQVEEKNKRQKTFFKCGQL